MADDKGTRGADGENVSDDATDDQVADDTGGGASKQVSYDTHKKLLSEKKAMQAKLKEFESKLANAENDKLAADGKKDELIAKYRADLEKVSKTHKETLNSFISQSLNAQVETIAAKMGAVDVDAVTKLLDLSDIEVDTGTFKADADSLESAIGELKKAKPYLFNKAAPKVNSKMPAGGQKTIGGKSLKEMSTAELEAALREMK
jgi:chromosome segregation ATPase